MAMNGSNENTQSDSVGAQEQGSEGWVGYKNPPKHSQFKAGQKNAGRAKGRRNRKTIMKQVAYEKHAVTENGESKQRTTWELLVLTLRKLAADGDPKAVKLFQELIEKYLPEETTRRYGYLVAPAECTREEFEAELKARRDRRNRETDV